MEIEGKSFGVFVLLRDRPGACVIFLGDSGVVRLC